jgi:hypothetical protein
VCAREKRKQPEYPKCRTVRRSHLEPLNREPVVGDRLSVVGEAAQSEGQGVGRLEGQKASGSEENTVTFPESPTTDSLSHRLPITDH